MDIPDKMILTKRFVIQTILGVIKLLGTLIHHRNNSPVSSVFTHLFVRLISYQIYDYNLSLNQLLKLNDVIQLGLNSDIKTLALASINRYYVTEYSSFFKKKLMLKWQCDQSYKSIIMN